MCVIKDKSDLHLPSPYLYITYLPNSKTGLSICGQNTTLLAGTLSTVQSTTTQGRGEALVTTQQILRRSYNLRNVPGWYRRSPAPSRKQEAEAGVSEAEGRTGGCSDDDHVTAGVPI